MTDNTQELDEIFLSFEPYKGEDYGSMTEYRITKIRLDEAKQAILDWHNKQIEEVLDRLESKAAYDPSGMSPLINPREIQAERTKLEAEL